MAKSRSQFICQQCGYAQVGWAGKCPNCGEWNTLVETVVAGEPSKGSKAQRNNAGIKPQKLTEIKSVKLDRVETKITELDRALGGGLVPGQVILLAGEPGIGKSTLLLQLGNYLKKNILYVSGEESINQIKIRADRLKVNKDNILMLEETDIDSIIASADTVEDLGVIIIDSIQTMSTSDLSGMAGSVGQVRECASRLVRLAKSTNTPIFIVGHVTKEGTVAGPSTLAHIVDTVLWFEGDKSLTLRLIRAVKNRFGATDEVGIFEMNDTGLVSIKDAGKLFLTEQRKNIPGSVVTSIMEGTRPILVEIQSLVVPTKLAFPKRVSQGIDPRRLEVILAVLVRRCGLQLFESDVFVNVAGGIKVTEPGADLAVALSIASAYFDKPVGKGVLAIGEVGLLGEIRQIGSEAKRVKEAKRIGFTKFVTPSTYSFVGEVIRKLSAISK